MKNQYIIKILWFESSFPKSTEEFENEHLRRSKNVTRRISFYEHLGNTFNNHLECAMKTTISI